MELHEARTIAEGLVDMLSSACERIEIAGSIRREKPTVRDVEIVAIAKFGEGKQIDMFNTGAKTNPVNLLNQRVTQIASSGVWQYDEQLRRDGHRYKRLRHAQTWMACDLFITTPEKWGLIYAIRTGPAAFSKAIVTEFHKHGWHQHLGQLHQHSKLGGKPCEKGAQCPLIIPTPEEADVFNVLSWGYLPPSARGRTNPFGLGPAYESEAALNAGKGE